MQGSNGTCDLWLAPFYTNAQASTYPVHFQHDSFTPSSSDLSPLVVAPFDTPTKRYSGFIQDQWRITPALTVNAGVRYDTETLYNGCAGTPDTESAGPAAPTAAPSTRRRSRSPTSGRRASA